LDIPVLENENWDIQSHWPRRLAQVIEASGFYELPVTARHAATVAALPPLHSDPFDRLLIAQAMSEPLHLVTADERLLGLGTIRTLANR